MAWRLTWERHSINHFWAKARWKMPSKWEIIGEWEREKKETLNCSARHSQDFYYIVSSFGLYFPFIYTTKSRNPYAEKLIRNNFLSGTPTTIITTTASSNRFQVKSGHQMVHDYFISGLRTHRSILCGMDFLFYFF